LGKKIRSLNLYLFIFLTSHNINITLYTNYNRESSTLFIKLDFIFIVLSKLNKYESDIIYYYRHLIFLNIYAGRRNGVYKLIY